MQKISDWANSWLVTFNPNKTESLLFSRKINQPHHPPINMNGQNVNTVDTHKHLGLTFDKRLSWHTHIDLTVEKAWKRINIMRKLKYLLDRNSLQTVYFSFIRPLLEYADVVWDNCTQYEANELEKIQHEAGRIVTGTTQFVSIEKLHMETGWKPLSSRRKFYRLTLFYKMVHMQVPPYLSSLVPDTVGNQSRYNLRNDTDLQIISCITNLYQISFLPSTVLK